jgi:hypothetical protein
VLFRQSYADCPIPQAMLKSYAVNVNQRKNHPAESGKGKRSDKDEKIFWWEYSKTRSLYESKNAGVFPG